MLACHSRVIVGALALLVAAQASSAEYRDDVGRIAHYLTVGIVHTSRGETQLAMAALDSVRRLATERLRQRPDDDLLEAALGQAYAGLGRCDEALSHAERAVALLPLSLDAFTGPSRRLEVDPAFAPLRLNQRFARLIGAQ